MPRSRRRAKRRSRSSRSRPASQVIFRSRAGARSCVFSLAVAPSCSQSAFLSHRYGNDRAREESQRPHGSYGPREPEEVGDHARREGAYRVAHVPPEAVYAQGAGPPGGVRVVRDGRDEGGIDHGCPEPKQDAAHDPPPEAPAKHGDEERGRLHPHAAYDEALASPAVAQGAGSDLQYAPDRRIGGLEDADALHPHAEGGEK